MSPRYCNAAPTACKATNVLVAHQHSTTAACHRLSFVNAYIRCSAEHSVISGQYTKSSLMVQVLERQKQWQQRWRERHEREGTLYDAIAVVEDVIIGR